MFLIPAPINELIMIIQAETCFELFRLEERVFLSIMRTRGLIRQKITGGKSTYTIEHLLKFFQ